jgi:hypothetical protein
VDEIAERGYGAWWPYKLERTWCGVNRVYARVWVVCNISLGSWVGGEGERGPGVALPEKVAAAHLL